MYLVADPDILKHIMVKDFSHFVDRIPVSIIYLFLFCKLYYFSLLKKSLTSVLQVVSQVWWLEWERTGSKHVALSLRPSLHEN